METKRPYSFSGAWNTGFRAFLFVSLFLGVSCVGRPPLLNAILSNEIVFYGQVLDLEGNPIPNAEVKYSSLNSGNFDDVWTKGGSYKNLFTDSEGKFEIREIGGCLYVRCYHKDYYACHNRAESSQRNFGYGFQGGDDPAWEPQKPAVFRLRKKGVCEPLYYSCSSVIGKGQEWIEIPREGITINLANGKIEDSGTSIYISYKSSKSDDFPKNYAWGHTLSIPGGGFVKKEGDFNFIAPESGYKEEVEIGYSQNEEGWSRLKTCHYFVVFPNGLCGIFEIVASGKSGKIMFQTLINPNPDSRNLEYEYEKQINKNQGSGWYGTPL